MQILYEGKRILYAGIIAFGLVTGNVAIAEKKPIDNPTKVVLDIGYYINETLKPVCLYNNIGKFVDLSKSRLTVDLNVKIYDEDFLEEVSVNTLRITYEGKVKEEAGDFIISSLDPTSEWSVTIKVIDLLGNPTIRTFSLEDIISYGGLMRAKDPVNGSCPDIFENSQNRV